MASADRINSSAKPSRIDAFLKLVSPFGILESARTGMQPSTLIPLLPAYILTRSLGLMALPRTPLAKSGEELETKEAEDVVDASALPPG